MSRRDGALTESFTIGPARECPTPATASDVIGGWTSRRSELARLALVLLLAAVPLSALPAQEPPDTSAPPGIIGVVLDRQTREPLEGVAVTLQPLADTVGALSEATVASTDAEGRFAFRGLTDGAYRIELRRIGYGTLADSVSYRAALGLRIEAELVPEAVELQPLLVAVDARSRRLEARGFYERLERGMGHFITRDQIESRDPHRVTDMLVAIPGVRLYRGGTGAGGPVVLLRGGCVGQVFVDGVRTVSPYSLDATLQPHDVAGIEVYQASELPAGYRVSACGAVLVWTRVPEATEDGGRPLGWEHLLIPLGFAGAVLLLIL